MNSMNGIKRQGLSGIVLAGGHGFLKRGRSKLIESISPRENIPLVSCPVSLMSLGLGISPVWVAVNHRFRGQLKEALKFLPAVRFVEQNSRTGTAGGVMECLQTMESKGAGCRHLLVLYGDMPLWKIQAVKDLVESHLEHEDRPVITMFSIEIGPGTPAMVNNYGRIFRNGDGKIIAIREPGEISEEETRAARFVNPSAWVFDCGWLKENFSLLKPHDKGDGYHQEYWLPDLAPIAAFQKRVINEVLLKDHRQAVGVNTWEDFFLAREIYASSA